jgi:hypothetical protein
MLTDADRSTLHDWLVELLARMLPGHVWPPAMELSAGPLLPCFVGQAFADDRFGSTAVAGLWLEDRPPTQAEWLGFLVSCTRLRAEQRVLVTLSRVTPEQRREALAREIVLIEGYRQLDRLGWYHQHTPPCWPSREVEPPAVRTSSLRPVMSVLGMGGTLRVARA